MQRVLAGLNPKEGPDFVVVYIDDVLFFSHSLDDHLKHLQAVLGRIKEAGLKLQPGKCKFIREEVKYLRYIVTPKGLKTNTQLVAAVRDLLLPQDIYQVRILRTYFLWRFISGFSEIAHPLHRLTHKGAKFKWTQSCNDAFLKQKLTEAPVLAYPSFNEPFILETDASSQGLGAILCQHVGQGTPHPVAYASRSLSKAELNYSITELKTLAVVWAITHFHAYLYGNEVTVYTDHSAV